MRLIICYRQIKELVLASSITNDLVQISTSLNDYTVGYFEAVDKSLDKIAEELEILSSVGFCSELCKHAFNAQKQKIKFLGLS